MKSIFSNFVCFKGKWKKLQNGKSYLQIMNLMRRGYPELLQLQNGNAAL